MANRFPLIANSSANQIQELAAADNLDLTSSGIVNVGNIQSVGIVTATTFIGNLTGTASTATESATAFGLTGSPSIQVSSLNVTTGVSTFKGAYFNGGSALREKVNITAGKLSDNTNINLENGMVHFFTTTETTTSTPNIRVSASISLNSVMAVGDTVSVTIITTAAAAGFSANITIDGNAVTERWLGGSAPTTGGSSGNDIYSFQIIKTASATYTVLANLTNAA
jgi:hypothetical protein